MEKTPKQIAQAAAAKKWYLSPKGAAYRQKQKEKRALAGNKSAPDEATGAPQGIDGQLERA